MLAKDLTLFIAKRLADKPDAVSIDVEQEGGTAYLNLVVDEGDKGKVIGKQGKVIKAIRALVGVANQKAGTRSEVEID